MLTNAMEGQTLGKCQFCGLGDGFHASDCAHTKMFEEAIKKQRLLERGAAEDVDWSTPVLIENKLARESNFQWLSSQQALADPFPTSIKIANPDISSDPSQSERLYEEELQPYEWQVPDDQKHFWGGDGNVGHKLHLNVPLASVRVVAQHLKLLSVKHKFLSGGEVADGKMFTVYCGSKDRADIIAQQISRDLSTKLSRPIEKSEVEYAPNVVGRFLGGRFEYHQWPLFGMRGLSSLEDDTPVFSWGYKDKTPEERAMLDAQAFRRAYEFSANKYGTYFYGSKQG